MKQTENNEIDLLLRSLAREGSTTAQQVSARQERVSSAHLDTDELSAYAQRALPAAARARYTTHLADCTRCRQIVAELASSLTPNTRETLIDQKPALGFWQKVGSIFSPAVLRYAIPAVLLFAVAGITFVALRKPQQPEFVAQNAEPSAITQKEQIDTPKEPETKQQPIAAATRATDQVKAEPSKSEPSKFGENKSKLAERAETSKAAGSGETVSVTSEKDAAAPGKAAAVAQPTFAPEPVAAPPAKPQSTLADSKNETFAKEKSTDKESLARQQEDEGARRKREDRENQVAASKDRSAQVGVTSGRGLHNIEAGRAGAKKRDDDGEVLTVGGRRFRRQGSVWVDTAYQASTATTVIARGSEQYRGLIADEPGIRTIAEQLAGEVVLVWKGRAYRIR